MRIIHWRRVFRNTGKFPRSLRPSAVTSSLASTVPSPGHQFTTDSLRCTNRWPSSSAPRSATDSSAQVPLDGVRVPSAKAAASSAIGLALSASVSYQAPWICRKIHWVQR